MDIEYLLLLQHFRESINGSLDPFMQGITKFIVSFIPFAIACVIFWAVDKKIGLLYLGGVSINEMLNGLIKLTACVYRPWIRDSRIEPAGDAKTGATGYSFPSGHSTWAGTFYGTTAAWTWKKRRLISVLVLIMFALTMFSRNYLGVHTPQDVLVGALGSVTCIYLFNRLMTYADREKGKRDIPIALGMLAAAILALIYIETKHYPMDYVNGKLLVDPQRMKPDTFGGIGNVIGFAAGWFIERRCIRYSFEKIEKERVLTAVICALPVYHLFNDGAVPFMCFGKCYASLISGFVLVFISIAVVPAVMKKCDSFTGCRRYAPALIYLLVMAFVFFVGFTGVYTGSMDQAEAQQAFISLLSIK